MTARTFLVPLLASAAALLLLVACGGGGEEEQLPGRLTDPGSVPTATPWAEPPEPIILGPDVLTPISGGEEENGGGGEEVEVTPVTPFKITSEKESNRRTAPSTDAAVAGTITAGQEATVTGQAAGEAVQGGNNLWYQLEDGSFVYSGAVQKVEE